MFLQHVSVLNKMNFDLGGSLKRENIICHKKGRNLIYGNFISIKPNEEPSGIIPIFPGLKTISCFPFLSENHKIKDKRPGIKFIQRVF